MIERKIFQAVRIYFEIKLGRDDLLGVVESGLLDDQKRWSLRRVISVLWIWIETSFLAFF